MMRTLGFDPSLTNFGWAVHDSDGVAAGRCLARGRFRTSSATLFVDRYCDLRASVISLLSQYDVARVGVEYPVFDELYSEGMYGLFLYTCEALKLGCRDVVFFSPGQIKAQARQFLGRPKNWKMQKPDMVEAAQLDAGGGRWNHNEADAYLVAKAAARFWQFYDGSLAKEDLTIPEKQQFAHIHTYKRGKKAGETEHRGILYREDERFFQWSRHAQGRAKPKRR